LISSGLFSRVVGAPLPTARLAEFLVLTRPLTLDPDREVLPAFRTLATRADQLVVSQPLAFSGITRGVILGSDFNF
jgi:hypothetical protein